MLGAHATQQDALAEPMFGLYANWCPRMLVEYIDGSFGWVMLGNYSGRARGVMTNTEKKQAINAAAQISDGDIDAATGNYVRTYSVKRGVLVQDNRKREAV